VLAPISISESSPDLASGPDSARPEHRRVARG